MNQNVCNKIDRSRVKPRFDRKGDDTKRASPPKGKGKRPKPV
jgi:hypothetical protein